MDAVKNGTLKTEENQLNTANLQSRGTNEPSVGESGRTTRALQDLPGLRHETRDVLQQMQANILILEDLSGRLGFALNEVRSLIRR
ncbi:MAG: hypothetical protein HC902_10780 [Calothrix sp. SM1_5_4]|nr:hypothetical protein [Calothrix sp. SM1_5_4]